MWSPRRRCRVWIGCVSTRAILVPAGTAIEVVLAAEATGESGGVVCCAKLQAVRNSVVVRARARFDFVLARLKKLVRRRRATFGAIAVLLLKAEAFRSWRGGEIQPRSGGGGA